MRAVVGLAVSFLALALMTAPSVAAGSCPEGTAPSPGHGTICIPVEEPGSPGGSGGEEGAGGGGATECTRGETPIDCEYAGGTWSNEHQCYLFSIAQPPADSELWGIAGGSPEEGQLFGCVRPWESASPGFVFVPDGEVAPPDPAELARRALDEMRLTVPDVHTAPEAPDRTYVGLDTWLWIPTSQWATLTKSVTVGSTTVTVSAEPRSVVWSMGAGSTTCQDAGRPWRKGMSSAETTTCKFVYDRMSPLGEPFAISVAITFRAEWTCEGNCLAAEGSLGDVDGLPGRSSIAVSERQSVNTQEGR